MALTGKKFKICFLSCGNDKKLNYTITALFEDEKKKIIFLKKKCITVIDNKIYWFSLLNHHTLPPFK